MSKLDEENPRTKLEKRIKEKYPTEYDKYMAMDRPALNLEIQILAKGMADNSTLKQEDDALIEAREHYNSLNKDYTDYQKAGKEKIQYIRNRTKELGEE